MEIRPISALGFDEWRAMWLDYASPYLAGMDAEVHRTTFARLVDPHCEVWGFAAVREVPVGFAHCHFHASTFEIAPVCYLEDLYVSPLARRAGIGRLLLERVRRFAKEKGAASLYWQTRAGNAAARAMYDKVAVETGFVTYELDL